MIDDPLVMNVVMLVISSIVGGVVGFQIFIFKSLANHKDDINRLELKIVSEYSKKEDLTHIVDQLESRIEQRMNDHFKILTNQLQREIRK